jgi:hypothetical protein
LAVDSRVRALFDELVHLPLIEGNDPENILFASPVAGLGDPVSPPQGAGLMVLSVGDGILTHLSFRSPDPTRTEPKWLDQGHQGGILTSA